jgi:hypothetical protein
MKLKAFASVLGLLFVMGCGSSSHPTQAISATGGTTQSATIATAFAAPLAATVTRGGHPASGLAVVFTAPTSGASGTFANGTNTETDTTNASGVATSSAFTANDTSGAYSVTASVSGTAVAATFSMTNIAGAPIAIATSSGTPQTTPTNSAFGAPLAATVVDDESNPVSGVVVTFTAPATDPKTRAGANGIIPLASGTFTNETNTETDITDANGVATSSTFTANGTVGGPYTVTATAAGVDGEADFILTNTAVVVLTTNYSFYLSGLELSNDGPNFYALAGSVSVDAAGNVVAGEQDYNDAFGLTSPEPSGDLITGGTLTSDPTTGQGTLTLITNNETLGDNGVETLAVQFVNTKHALVIQFDDTATSSGSMDLQTLPSTLSGNYAFTLSGVDPDYDPIVLGGVFSISGTTLQNGLYDVNDNDEVTLGTSFTGTVSAPDAFGRGTIVSAGLVVNLSYYIIGPEAIRIIDVDEADSGFGSAYGQGAGAFSNTSLGSSVFGVENNSWGFNYAAAGQFTVPSNGTFQGVADNDEEGEINNGSDISGTYSIATNGYGSLTITSETLDDVSALGIYMTDPNINLSDPNNTATGLGGALLADMDDVIGTGVLIPQSDTATASFAGNYAFGDQNFFGGEPWEFDFVGQGSVTAGVLAGTGLINDPGAFVGPAGTDVGATFSGTATPDGTNPGRYTMPLAITTGVCSGADLGAIIYQASGSQLLWMDEDEGSLSLGSFQQQGSLTGLPAAKKALPKAKRRAC